MTLPQIIITSALTALSIIAMIGWGAYSNAQAMRDCQKHHSFDVCYNEINR